MRRVKSRNDSESCQRCGYPTDETAAALDIPIKKGDVRRAIRAADGVEAAATQDDGASTPNAKDPEPGVVLMTAVLLIERVAATYECEPAAVLNHIARCFELKQEHLTALELKHSN
jgi:hypothetical protein